MYFPALREWYSNHVLNVHFNISAGFMMSCDFVPFVVRHVVVLGIQSRSAKQCNQDENFHLSKSPNQVDKRISLMQRSWGYNQDCSHKSSVSPLSFTLILVDAFKDLPSTINHTIKTCYAQKEYSLVKQSLLQCLEYSTWVLYRSPVTSQAQGLSLFLK